MQFHFQQALRAFILLSFSILIYKLHFTGEIAKFINPKYDALSQAAAFIFIILFFIQMTRVVTIKEDHHHGCPDHDDDGCGHDHGDSRFNGQKLLSYSIIVFPLVTGFFLPAKVLDASIAEKKGAMLAISGSSKAGSQQNKSANIEDGASDSSLDPNAEYDPTTSKIIGYENEITGEEYDRLIKNLDQSVIEMDDLVYSSFYEEIAADINKFKGRKISLKGFVYKEQAFAEDQLVISRFLVTHCVADASIIGFLSQFPDAAKINKDTWISAEGELEVTTYNGITIPLIKVTKWEKISEPKEPYLYPISINRTP